ncbi:TIGR04211 family SH3 domain-containing protein [Orbus sturtevantii]|uniref:TIGR04211 family SH3 domain-containing protein n=1 Tax=Orbus sturtevantii TaxID=3074109 RepID=UPI00370CFEB6
MNKKNLLIAVMFSCALQSLMTFTVLAADKYIAEDLSVYLKRGPGPQYGIIGSLKSGEQVSVLETSSDGKYTRIRDSKNRASWIESEFLSDVPNLKERLPALEQELAILKDKANSATQDRQALIDNYTNQLTVANQKITELEKRNSELQAQADEQLSNVESLNNQLDEKRQNLILSWFLRGGLVAGIGLVAGLVLPFIIPRRKKNNWMN